MHVVHADGLTDATPANLSRQRILVENLGGTYHQVVGDDVPRALLTFAKAENATQLVLGASRRGRLARILSAGTGVTTTALSGSIDVHMVTHEQIGRGRRRLPRFSAGLTLRRRLYGAATAAVLLPLLTLALTDLRGSLNLTSDVLLFLLAIVAVPWSGASGRRSPPPSPAGSYSTTTSSRRCTSSLSPNATTPSPSSHSSRSR